MKSLNEQLPAMTRFLKRLVESESPSGDKPAVDRLGSFLSEEFHSIGVEIEEISNKHTGNHIIARFFTSDRRSRDKGFLLLCHMDTVYPIGTLKTMPFLEQGERILGPGVADMKAGIVIGFSAIQHLQLQKKLPACPVTLLITSDEEIGSPSSKELIENLALQSKLVLVLEPGMPDGAIKTWRKGVGEFRITAHGQAAHSGGDHEKGRNAIEELAHQIIKLQSFTDYSRGTTLNVGVVQGGTAVNVVPDMAYLDVDLRVMQPGEAERITALVQSLRPVLTGTSLQVSGGLNRPPMPYDERMHATFEHARLVAEKHGIHLTASGTGGASDANFVAPLGIPVLDGLGAIGGNYHSEKEYILTESLVTRTQLLSALLQDW